MKCVNEILSENKSCQNKECKFWIDYYSELNCSNISIQKNGPMDLEAISKRIHVTAARVQQIENQALVKLSKRFPKNQISKTILEE